MGCGWLGFPLAKRLIAEAYAVSGTTTSEHKIAALQEAGIQAYTIALGETAITGAIDDFLNGCDILIINVPPKLRGDAKHNSFVQKMATLIAHIKISMVNKVVFVSSTSVYSDAQGTVTEATIPTPESTSGIQLLACEQLFQKQTQFQTTIVRFGGLVGPNRHPVTMLAAKKELTNGHAPINLIHLTDCITVLSAIISEKQWGETFNVVHPKHPAKKDYYKNKAIALGLTPPKYTTETLKITKKINTCRFFLTKLSDNFTSP